MLECEGTPEAAEGCGTFPYARVVALPGLQILVALDSECLRRILDSDVGGWLARIRAHRFSPADQPDPWPGCAAVPDRGPRRRGSSRYVGPSQAPHGWDGVPNPGDDRICHGVDPGSRADVAHVRFRFRDGALLGGDRTGEGRIDTQPCAQEQSCKCLCPEHFGLWCVTTRHAGDWRHTGGRRRAGTHPPGGQCDVRSDIRGDPGCWSYGSQ